MTRAQVANLLWGFAGNPPPSRLRRTHRVSAWAQDAVRWLVNQGHAAGYPGNLFKPNNNITRAENTRMVCRINTPPGTC